MVEADKQWISEQLSKLTNPTERGKILDAYNQAFKEVYGKEPMPHRKENAARFAANTRLRVYVKNRLKLLNRLQ